MNFRKSLETVHGYSNPYKILGERIISSVMPACSSFRLCVSMQQLFVYLVGFWNNFDAVFEDMF